MRIFYEANIHFYSDEFPLMVDIWEDMFGIDIEGGPQIGLVDLSDVCN